MGMYTEQAESALKRAQKISARMQHPYTGTEHILLGLLDEKDSTAGQVLAGAGVTRKGLEEMIDQLIAPEGGVLLDEGRGFTPSAKKPLACRRHHPGCCGGRSKAVSRRTGRNGTYSHCHFKGWGMRGLSPFKYDEYPSAGALYGAGGFHGRESF